jgi:hypothetical protein
MSEEEGQAGTTATRKPLTYAGAGVVGGAGFAASLFGVLGLQKILANTDNYASGYPIAVFGMVALFILVCGVAFAPLSQRGAQFVWFAVVAFAGIMIAGAYVFLRQANNNPTAYVTANFMPDPSSFTDVDKDSKLQLVMQYRTKNGSNQFAKYVDGVIAVRGRDGIDWKIVGLDQLENNYVLNYKSSQLFRKSLEQACRGVPSNSQNGVCDMVNAKMATDEGEVGRPSQ